MLWKVQPAGGVQPLETMAIIGMASRGAILGGGRLLQLRRGALRLVGGVWNAISSALQCHERTAGTGVALG